MPYQHIDQVIVHMEQLLQDALARESRAGYFAALYYRVTCAVRDAIRAGRFEDNARMEQFDILFAQRYFDAVAQQAQGELPSRVWFQAFDAHDNPRLGILQHLALGMNAHINLDLGIAAARLCPGGALQSLRTDFNRINEILASMVPPMDRALDVLCPGYQLASDLNPAGEERLINFSMKRARDSAWALAERLAPLGLAEQVRVLEQQDTLSALLADGIQHAGLCISLLNRLESQDVRHNIRVLLETPIPLQAIVRLEQRWDAG